MMINGLQPPEPGIGLESAHAIDAPRRRWLRLLEGT